MKTLISIEETGKLVATYLGSLYIGYAWWVFPSLLLVPDLSMVGYLVNPRVGAWLYNFFHHQALAIAVGLAGVLLGLQPLQLAGLVLFGHSAMDRDLGFGL